MTQRLTIPPTVHSTFDVIDFFTVVQIQRGLAGNSFIVTRHVTSIRPMSVNFGQNVQTVFYLLFKRDSVRISEYPNRPTLDT